MSFSMQVKHRAATKVPPMEPGPTEQAHKDDCDIQTILKRYQQTGVVQHNNSVQGHYDDYIDAPTFQDAQNAIAEAKSMFESVPAQIRRDFGNDPAQFLAFVQDESNIDKMREYGLALPSDDFIADPVPTDQNPPKSPPSDNEAPPGDSSE